MIPVPVLLTIGLAVSYLFCFSALAAKNSNPKICQSDPAYYCYKVKKGETWEKLFRDPNQQMVVRKINRMNTSLYQGKVIAVPKNGNVSVLDVAPLKKQIDPSGHKVIHVFLGQLAWGAYDENGNLVNWGPTSAGKGYCPDVRRHCGTPTGSFKIYEKRGRGCYSTRFPVGRGGAPMPYCMFFHGGFALHGSYEVPGYHASHGCVRMFINDAKWLNEEFVGSERVPVIIRQF